MVQAAVEKVLSSGELKGSDISGDRAVVQFKLKELLFLARRY